MIPQKTNLLHCNFSNLLTALFILIFCSLNAQTAGDYRSVATGDWSALSSWQYYNGSAWVTPTSTQGYPGQNNNAETVTINTGNTISINSSTTTKTINSLIINGTLDLATKDVNFNLNASNIIVYDSGVISFSNKANLYLPSNVNLQIINPNGLNTQSANADISIGNVLYGKDGDSSHQLSDLVTKNYTITVTATPTTVCVGGTINFQTSYSGITGTLNYSWSIKDPNNTITIYSTQNPTIATTKAGNYTATLTCTNTSNGNTSTKSATVTAKVLPIASILTQPTSQTVCNNNSATFSIVSNYYSTSAIWQSSIDGGLTYNNIAPNPTFDPNSGSSTLIVNNVNASMNGSLYRCAVSASGCPTNSNPATLTVNTTPAPIIGTVTQPTCAVSTGSFKISNYINSYIYSYPSALMLSGDTFTGPSGTYSIKATSNSCTSIASADIVINSKPVTPSPPSLNNVQPSCTVATGSIIVTSQNSGETYSFDNGANFQSNNNKTGLTAGNYVVIIKSSSGCNSTPTPTTINTQPTPLTQPILTTTQPTCSVLTGSINISSPTNQGVTYSIDGSNYLNTTGIFTLLNPGTYNVTAKNNSGCISSPSTVILSSSAGKTWKGTDKNWFNAANWTPTGVPTKDDCVTINNATTLSIDSTTQNAYAYSITIINGSILEIATKSSLTVTNDINVNTGGTFTIQESGSLIQVNEADPINNKNKGNITVKRNTAPTSWNDYTYWSSPTSDVQTLFDFSPNSNPKYFLTYDNTWNYAYPKIAKFTPGIGYAIMAPTNATTASKTFNYQFIGTPNNGTVTIPVTTSSTNIYSSKLVGNPYPSAISAEKFILANAQTISGTIYFWTHSQNTANGSNSSNYATYNLTGGTGTGKGTAANTDINSGHGNHNTPEFYIASGQGFIIQTKTKGDITFNNSMRVGIAEGANNSNFYRSSNTNSHQLEKHRIWLNLSDNSANFSQILLAYVESATNDYDPGFDGAYTNNDKFAFYSLINNESYSIQAKELPFNNSDTFSIGFTTDIKGEQTISINNTDGLFAQAQNVYIEDKLTNTTHNLNIAPYTFSSEAGTFNDRFIIKYKDDSMLGIDTFEGNQNNISITSENHIINVKCENENIQKVFVYDTLGRQISEKSNVNNYDFTISNLSSNQVYIVKAILANGQSYSKKVIN